MKKIAFLFSTLLFSSILFAQEPDNYCGTEMPEEMIQWLKNYRQQAGDVSMKQGDETIYYIPLKAHIVGNNEGGGYYKVQSLLDAMCKLNEQFEEVGFHYYLLGDVNYINNTALYDHSGSFNSIITNSKAQNAANVYFVEDPSGNCGYFSGWRDYVAIKKSCGGPSNTTVAHEMGHYFSLPHTFYGWESRNQSEPPRATDERVSGSNCRTAGDFFCDTPADFISNRWNCPYTGTKVDFNGDPYVVDGSLFMSYANDNCQNKFSPEQIDAMRANLLSVRSNLLNHPQPNVEAISSTENIYPPAGATGIPSNYAQIKWRKAEGATHYNLQMTRYFNGTFLNVDMITSDTSVVITNLDPVVIYRWRVRPFNSVNTCTEFTTYSTFVTKEPTAIVPNYTVSSISCPERVDGAVTFNPTGGAGGYTYKWSNGASSSSVDYLLPGNYFITIVDATNDSVVIFVNIVEPKPIQAEITQTPSFYGLRAVAEGGTPPYTYNWSNGSTSQEIGLENVGEYYVTITDSRGCNTFKTFMFTGINENPFIAESRIYPNPLGNNNMLTIELHARENFFATIDLFDNTGRRIALFEKQFNTGNNRETLVLPSLIPGIYLVRINSNDGFVTNRLLVF